MGVLYDEAYPVTVQAHTPVSDEHTPSTPSDNGGNLSHVCPTLFWWAVCLGVASCC